MLTRVFLCASLLNCSACLRYGYEDVRSSSAADSGRAGHADAGAFDASLVADAASTMDASALATDAAYANDATTPRTPLFDASGMDAASMDASARADASSILDASGAGADAAASPDAAVSCASSVSLDYCSQLPALPAEPLLDGTLDCGPSLIDLPVVGWNSGKALPADNHARYAAAWRPDGLYFYVEVDDALQLPALASDVDPWCGDGVELYADNDGVYTSAPDYDDPGTIQLLATSPAADPTTKLAVDARYHTRSQQRIGDWAPSQHVSVLRDNGYALEAFITAAELDLSTWQLAAGGKVGFDIAINVAVADASQTGSCGYLLGQYYLRVSRTPCNRDACRPYSNVAAFCTPTLD